jgi:hypothetical protein
MTNLLRKNLGAFRESFDLQCGPYDSPEDRGAALVVVSVRIAIRLSNPDHPPVEGRQGLVLMIG